jgi:hypothetical protein
VTPNKYHISCKGCARLTAHKPVVVGGERRWECLDCGAQTKTVMFYVKKAKETL